MLSWTPYILTVYVLLTKGTAGIVVVLVAQAAINYALKVTIREPRPDTSCGWSVWGMPSAHTQLMVLLVLMVWPTSPSARIVALLLMAQRVWSNCHTIPQVLAGAATGAAIHHLSVSIVNNK